MNKDPEMQGTTTPNQDTEPAHVEKTEATGQEVVLDPSDNLMVAEATLETKLSDGSVMETTVVPKKKKHTGLIVVIVTFVVLLLAAIGAGIWYFVCYNNPEKAAYDAINGLLQEKSLITNASLSGKIGEAGSESVRLSASLHTEGEDASAVSEITFSVAPIDANGSALTDKPYQFKLANVVLSDGVFYIRTEDLADAFDNFVTDADLSTEETDLIFEAISEIIATVDEEWWQISVPELVDTLMEDSAEAQSTKEFYTCLVNVANQDVKGEIAKIYGDNRFINVAKSTESAKLAGNTLYDVNLDYDKMAGFINAMPNSGIANGIYNCYNRYMDATNRSDEKISAESAETVTADDLRKEFSTEDTTVQMQITNWGHQLTQIDAKSTKQDATFSMSFDRSRAAEVKAPESYRSITELYDDLAAIFADNIGSQFGNGYKYDPETGILYEDDELVIYNDGADTDQNA